MTDTGQILALSGGVGGAKLAAGLQHVSNGQQLTIVANTGDDFVHMGLNISPDIDTLLYTLSGLSDPARGWGRADESWTFMAELERLGGDTWFRLGDKDLAVHVFRSNCLRHGSTLSHVTQRLAEMLSVRARILPMSDDPVSTRVETADGTLEFQEYFVRDSCHPVVRGIYFHGSDSAALQPDVEALLRSPLLSAIVICPSNPWLSIAPILSVRGMREAIRLSGAPVIAVSPIVAGTAIKGPTAKIMAELGFHTSARSVADHYAGLIDGFVLDSRDEALSGDIAGSGIDVAVTNTVMHTATDRSALAKHVLEFAASLRGKNSG